ncbi:MAG: hypothetical protein U0V70_06665 [Terriglobia bacterium]
MGDIAQAVCAAAELNQVTFIVVGRGAISSALGRFRTHTYTIIRESPSLQLLRVVRNRQMPGSGPCLLGRLR